MTPSGRIPAYRIPARDWRRAHPTHRPARARPGSSWRSGRRGHGVGRVCRSTSSWPRREPGVDRRPAAGSDRPSAAGPASRPARRVGAPTNAAAQHRVERGNTGLRRLAVPRRAVRLFAAGLRYRQSRGLRARVLCGKGARFVAPSHEDRTHRVRNPQLLRSDRPGACQRSIMARIVARGSLPQSRST